jgi:hypothetical protein
LRQRQLQLDKIMDSKGARARFWFTLIAVALAYLPSLQGGFIPFDDDWMVQNNEFYQQIHPGSFQQIWLDLSQKTRLLLGAEYLPLRDTTVLIDIWMFGFVPQAMRAMNLGWYLVASCFCILSWRRILGVGRPSSCFTLFMLSPLRGSLGERMSWGWRSFGLHFGCMQECTSSELLSRHYY